LSYKGIPFTATVETFGFDTDFRARVSFFPRAEESEDRLIFEFLEPESLCGIELELEGDGAELRLGGKTYVNAPLPLDQGRGIGKVARMLLPSESVLSIKSSGGGECGMPMYERLTVVETASFTIHIDPASGLPIKITDKASGAFITVEMIQSDKSTAP
jgi:hypothetical protein